jgi:diguanylate cyclase (GGDEF)-like protein
LAETRTSTITNEATDFGDFPSFSEAAHGIMDMLDACHGVDAWFVTRIRLDEWIVTHFRGDASLKEGGVLPLSRREREAILRGPFLKTRAELELEDVAARRGGELPAPAEEHGFIGAPLVVNDQLYGALCGVKLGSPPGDAERQSPILMTAARIMSTILRRELEAEELLRRAERAEADALVDELTGLFNRRGWERLTEREDTRAARYGHGATVFMMDVDGLKRKNDEAGHAAGDAMLRSVADAIRSVIRDHDVAARVGGDEFAVLAVESNDADAEGLDARFGAAFAAAGVTVSIGTANRSFVDGIAAAVERADAAMYQIKAARLHGTDHR